MSGSPSAPNNDTAKPVNPIIRKPLCYFNPRKKALLSAHNHNDALPLVCSGSARCPTKPCSFILKFICFNFTAVFFMLSSPYLISCVGCPAPLNVLSNNFSSPNLVSALHNRKRCSDTDLTIMILLKCKFYNRRNRNIKSVSLQFNKCNSPVISRVTKTASGQYPTCGRLLR